MKNSTKAFARILVAMAATGAPVAHAMSSADNAAMAEAIQMSVKEKLVKCGQPNRAFMKLVHNSTSTSYYELADLKFVNFVGSEHKISLAESLNGNPLEYSGTVQIESPAYREYLIGYSNQWLNWIEGHFATIQIEKRSGKWSAKVVSGPDTSGEYSEYSELTCGEIPAMPTN
ncbi:hypothetical protein H0X91_04355 [Burkholderia sp. 9777_1386]|uniref:hypothetical protein n=1 Tax=Burkholderia sp. 9777_1386 TaxID=2751183 RepID=UPI0018C3AB49|nr:hypothetical protein [Burkholderia sp. 9777_1386]MBG0869201.1 hypothetical protein [Burkholderia sp. 9777_1386]